jgi:hypothetical protein
MLVRRLGCFPDSLSRFRGVSVRRCRLAVCALLAVAAAAFGVLPVAQAAQAVQSDSDIQILSVSVSAGNPAQLTVKTDSGTPITSLTVHFQAGPAISDFDLSGAGSGPQTFQVQLTSTDPTSGNYLPPDTYTMVTVDAGDSGDPVSGVPVQGPFPFQIQPTVMLNPPTIDFDHPTVTFAGQVTGLWPGTTTPRSFANEQVMINGQFGPFHATTDQNGDFSAAAPAVKPGQLYQAQLAPDSDETGATSSMVKVTQTADAVQLTAGLARGTIKYKQTDSVSGTVTYQPTVKGKFQPLANTKVTIDRTSPAGQPITTTTGPTGKFTAKLPPQTATGQWTVSAGGTALLDVADKNLKLNVQLPTAFRQVSIGLSAFRLLSVKACLNVTSPGGNKDSLTVPVTLQYASRAKGPWKNLRIIDATRGGHPYCATGTSSWQTAVTAPLANAYYRLSFGGNSSLQASASAPVHRWRYPTRITGFNITPRSVAAQGAVTVSGRLWHNTGSWHPYAHRKVGILFRFHGQWFIYQAEPETNSGGYFSGRFVVYVSSPWIAQYDGDTTNFGSASPQIKVTVTSAAVMVPHGGPGEPRLARR